MEICPVEMSKMIGLAFTIRNASDYDDMFIARKSDTEEQLANAEYVYNVINKYIYELVNGRAGKENSE
jgi:hypothetical protein